MKSELITWDKVSTSMMLPLLIVVLLVGCSFLSQGCGNPSAPSTVAISGVKEVRPEVKTGSDGKTSEQRNIQERLKRDNLPGAIKHLYVFSAMTGDCLLYSTVREKVSSSGKRLSPTTVATTVPNTSAYDGIPVYIDGRQYRTGEVLQDDGAYGSSIEYLYWIDARGVYHQHYPAGGQIVHISDQPMPIKKVVVNLEIIHTPADAPAPPTGPAAK